MQELLMIEDDVRLAGMVSDYLGQNGFGVGHAPDAQSGLARLQTAGVDLVILDLMLPDMDGLQVCQRIRALPGALGQVPVLMLTAKGDPMDRIIGLEMGADDYLPKPFEPRELLARIKAILRRKSAPPRSQQPGHAVWLARNRPRCAAGVGGRAGLRPDVLPIRCVGGFGRTRGPRAHARPDHGSRARA